MDLRIDFRLLWVALALMALLLVSGCRSYRYNATTDEIEVLVFASDSNLGRLRVDKKIDGSVLLEIENLTVEQRLSNILAELAGLVPQAGAP